MVAFGTTGRDEILIERVQRESSVGPRTRLGGTPTFEDNVEKL